MLLTRLRIAGFSSYSDSDWIDLEAGLNLIVGQNNVGKSALLRALGTFPDDRHKDENAYSRERLPLPRLDLWVKVSWSELEGEILRSNIQVIWPAHRDGKINVRNLMENVKNANFEFEIYRYPSQSFVSTVFPSHKGFKLDNSFRSFMLLPNNGKIDVQEGSNSTIDNISAVVGNLISSMVFSFDAQRYGSGKCVITWSKMLLPNASNLPIILNGLQGERGGTLKKLIEHVRQIFPTVGNISVAATRDNHYEIRLWPTEDMLRPELSFGLEDSGTGVAQVIAILTVMLTYEHAIIIIDEIGTFLHPAAVKSLVRIMLNEYYWHQYIVSTHSMEVIGAREAATVHLVRREGYNSTIEKINVSDVAQLKLVAAELGFSISDVFGANTVVWVEGATEEICFRYIVETVCGSMPRGLSVIPVVATGSFASSKKRIDLILEIYHRLGSAASPLVGTTTFSFDGEALTGEEKQLLAKRASIAGGRLLFLPRRHLECYLIDPDAIVAFIVKFVPELAHTISTGIVREKLAVTAQSKKFEPPKGWAGDLTDVDWLSSVDAANLIKEVCLELTASKLEFAKKDHTLDILRYIMSHDRTPIQELLDYTFQVMGIEHG